MKGKLVVRVNHCVGCKTCEIACAVEHSQSGDMYQALQETPAPVARVKVMEGEVSFRAPMQCRQCADAACVRVCPKQALSRADADSPVIWDDDPCTRCRLCVLVCPYGMIALDERSNTIVKCDQCAHRLERDTLPACVVACPTGALLFDIEGAGAAEGEREFLVRVEYAPAEDAEGRAGSALAVENT
ncbi:MAG: 4Fe-4S dicluster domain-containing protein [Armatimonadota bacterium]